MKILILLQLFSLSLSTETNNNETLCTITYGETLFKDLFGSFISAPSNNTEEQKKFNKAKGRFRGIFPGMKVQY